MTINYLDLFSGCGGFRYGLDLAGVSIGYEAHSDIDKNANKTYERHFKNSEALNDIRSIQPVRGKLNGEKINLITFGFPCQDVSVAGDGKGLGGSRSSLFFEAIRLVRELKPETFIFENVKGLFSSPKEEPGRDFTTVLRTIADLGLYDCQWQLLNTRWFLPQNRERIYFVGHLRGRTRPKVFPIGRETERSFKRTKQTAVNCLTAGGNSGGLHSSMTLIAGTLRTHNDGKGFRATSNGDCPTIPARAREDGSGQPCVMGVLTPDRKEKRQNGPRFKKDISFTLTTQDRHGVYDGQYIRRLTPIECCRLHGFPDNWVNHLSDTQAYKQMGNTVSPVLTHRIFNRAYKGGAYESEAKAQKRITELQESLK